MLAVGVRLDRALPESVRVRELALRHPFRRRAGDADGADGGRGLARGNWWVDSHAVGIENEGFALQGDQWFTEQMYRSLARLTRYLAERYGIPLDREHLIGNDQVPGTFGIVNQRDMHWDPGLFFDWAHFMALVGAPITPAGGDRTGRIVTIDPTFASNRPVVTGCDPTCRQLPSQPANFVYLCSAPSFDAPLLSDVSLSGTALEPNGVGTTRADDWGDKAVTGRTFAVAERRGDWLAVWYGGQKAWLYDPQAGHTTIPGSGTLVTPKATFTLNPADHHVVTGTTEFSRSRSTTGSRS
jgi:N-acetylmuramoyl-L-alanine amidase